jgi:hypothetical protein
VDRHSGESHLHRLLASASRISHGNPRAVEQVAVALHQVVKRRGQLLDPLLGVDLLELLLKKTPANGLGLSVREARCEREGRSDGRT